MNNTVSLFDIVQILQFIQMYTNLAAEIDEAIQSYFDQQYDDDDTHHHTFPRRRCVEFIFIEITIGKELIQILKQKIVDKGLEYTPIAIEFVKCLFEQESADAASVIAQQFTCLAQTCCLTSIELDDCLPMMDNTNTYYKLIASMTQACCQGLKELKFDLKTTEHHNNDQRTMTTTMTTAGDDVSMVLKECSQVQNLKIFSNRYQLISKGDIQNLIRGLESMRHLTSLSLNGFSMDDEAWALLVEFLTTSNLRELNLHICGSLTHKSLSTCAQLFRSLERENATLLELFLDSCHQLFVNATDRQVNAFMEALQKCSDKVHSLYLTNVGIPSKATAQLLQAIKGIHGDVCVEDENTLSDPSTFAQMLKIIPQMTHVTELSIAHFGELPWDRSCDEQLVEALHKNPSIERSWFWIDGINRIGSASAATLNGTSKSIKVQCQHIYQRNKSMKRTQEFLKQTATSEPYPGGMFANALSKLAHLAGSRHCADPVYWLLRQQVNTRWNLPPVSKKQKQSVSMRRIEDRNKKPKRLRLE